MVLQIVNLSKKYTWHRAPRDTADDDPELLEDDAPAQEPEAEVEGERWALRGINATIKPGEKVGIIGVNGAGKSTLLNILAGITLPSDGYVRGQGLRVLLNSLRGPFRGHLTGRQNLHILAALLGVQAARLEARIPEILAFSDMEDFIDRRVLHYSTQQYRRLSFAAALMLDPEIILSDDTLGIGDARYQQRTEQLIAEKVEKDGVIFMIASNRLSTIQDLCTRAIWLEGGRVAADGPVDEVIEAFMDADTEGEEDEPHGEVEVASQVSVVVRETPSLQANETSAISNESPPPPAVAPPPESNELGGDGIERPKATKHERAQRLVEPEPEKSEIETAFQAKVAKLRKKSAPPSNRFANKPLHAIVASVLTEAEPSSADRPVRLARPYGQFLPFQLTRKSRAQAIYEHMRFEDWHYLSCNSGLIKLWDQMQAQLTFTERDKTIIETLRRDGIAISNVSEFISGEAFRLLVDDYQRRLRTCEDRLAPALKERDRDKPFLDRVATTEDLALEDNLPWNALYLDQGLAKIAGAHLGMVPRLGDVTLWRTRTYDNENAASHKWRRDGNDRASVRVFLYLNEVAPENGPLKYVLGSHYGGPRHDFLRDHSARIDDDELEAQAPDGAILQATGAAGTLVILDGGGLYCASRVLRGNRSLARMTYSTNADVAPKPLLLSKDFTLPGNPFMREVLGV